MNQETVIVVSSEGLGHGDFELCRKVANTYFTTLLEADLLPGAIVFYTSGVKLATAGSPCIEALRGLEQKGVRLIVCRTCLEFYGLAEHLEAGSIGTMLMVVEEQAKASKVITL